ncbi:MBL fold metallo-hydrolase [Paenarthrobacter sp. PH39-S1]|uniref:MBL fold metallo-hydrolase n=1 Tax=Paenarthrobacter sp. PH39-S1 TaxID=3046204 RepID=UPI0024BA3F24|nr:MBL fold metallo-hydrolase [Paenarthrobacter sp. PH39-S1]MDJ0356808.1 MBL fold metallo-hydrolase [Paenarthrobacter sp. PH39-S1]
MNRQALDFTPRVVTLGTAGGPRWWTGENAGKRSGIATAVVVGDVTYLVDAGHGVGRQMMLAGLPINSLRGIFVSHLHSDHTIDLGSLAIFGMFTFGPDQHKIHLIGPGDRGELPPVSPRAAVPPTPVFPENPTPGITAMFSHLMAAYATDLNDRILDSLRPSPYDYFVPQDITIPAATGYSPNTNPTPADMEPFEIYSDELVTVTATLVQHPPIAPAFAFRFDSADGSVTISGDTAPCENLVRLAGGTDLLLHEAIDFDWVNQTYGGSADGTGRASADHHRKSHTSAAEAVELATRAGAKALALHHLVPGTTPLSVWQSAGTDFAGDYYVPDDLDSIPFGQTTAATRKIEEMVTSR